MRVETCEPRPGPVSDVTPPSLPSLMSVVPNLKSALAGLAEGKRPVPEGPLCAAHVAGSTRQVRAPLGAVAVTMPGLGLATFQR